MSKFIITAGGTSERIDNVRKITNSSTGKLGLAIANEVLEIDPNSLIYYICSKGTLKPSNPRVKVVEIDGTFDLKDKVEALLQNEKIDYFIHSMAVSDYTTDFVTTIDRIKKSFIESKNVDDVFDNVEVIRGNKISSYEDNLVIVLKPTPKIISLIKSLSPDTYLVGFKLLDEVSKDELISVATRLRDKNSCDLVVANDLANIRKGNHQAYIIGKEDDVIEVSGKGEIANKLVRRMMYGK